MKIHFFFFSDQVVILLQDSKLQEAVAYGRNEFNKFNKLPGSDDLVKVGGKRFALTTA